MKTKVLNEGSEYAALIGMGLAFDKTNMALEVGEDCFFDGWCKCSGEKNDLYHQMLKRAKAMAFRGGGHNKFLRAIHVDLIVEASIDWWQEQATYTTTDAVQSTSTMHMLKKSGLKNGIDPLVDPVILARFEEMLEEGINLITLKKNLPCGYNYVRTIHLNYMTLQNMIQQRHNHKHPDWRVFCKDVLEQVKHPYFLKVVKDV
jgi:hypothetical protein